MNDHQSNKIIDTFQQRRQLAQDIDALAETKSEFALTNQVKAIVLKYDADLIIAQILKRLDTPSSQLRGGIGQIATLLPQEQIVPVLRNAAANRNNSPTARLTAVLILERFLGVEVSGALLSDIQNPEQVVMQSLKEALEEGRQNPYVLLEYVRQMRNEADSIAYMVMDLLANLPAEEQPELLRLIAYDSRKPVAEAAIQRLTKIREMDGGRLAALALHILQTDLAPALAEQARRGVRKLQFAGIQHKPVQEAGWRALIAPVRFNGDEDIWFIRNGSPGDRTSADGIFISLRINSVRGILQAFGDTQIPNYQLPPAQPLGHLLPISGPAGANVFLEAPFDYGRWRVQTALTAHWQASPAKRLPDDYTLHSPYLWKHPEPQIDPEVQKLAALGQSLWEETGEQGLEAVSLLFLQQPAIKQWYFRHDELNRLARQMVDNGNGAHVDSLVHGFLEGLFAQTGSETVIAEMRAALLAQAGWFSQAGQPRNAQHAAMLAESLRHVPPLQHPLLLAMAGTGLLLALEEQRNPSA
jgi:hypothetical protein